MKADVELDESYTEEPGLRFRDQEIPCEILNLDRGKDGPLRRCRLGFIATVPPTGYRVFRLAEKKEPRQNRIEFRDRRVMTPYFDLEVNPENGILQVWNKEGRQILRGNEIVIDEEIGDLYFHHSRLDHPIGSESGGGIRFAAFKPEEFKLEQGPLRTVITFKDAFYCLRWPYYLTEYFGPQIYRHKTVDITKQVIVYENLPRIDFLTTLYLQQSHVRIRLKFDTCMVAPKYTRQTQFGVIDLPHSRTLAEGVKAPSLSWVNGEEGDRGLAFLSCGVPINDIHAGEIYYTLLRSVSVLSADGSSGTLVPTPGAQELGNHSYIYSVYPHEGDWKKAEIHRRASEFNHRLFAFQMDGEAAKDELGTLTLEPSNLIISSLKKAEADDSVILRFYEMHGKACRTVLTLPPQVQGVLSTNLIEQEERQSPIRDGKLEIDVGPFEIVTLKLLLEE